jgi:[ribosomal protein S5]-alanine N-acetyltransferase
MVVDVSVIHTTRLELTSMSPSFISAILAGDRKRAEAVGAFKLPAGWPDERDRRLLRRRRDQMRLDPDSQRWLVRAMVLAEDRSMVGHIGFHGPPETVGRAELGYSVMAERRREGYASEAATAMMDWAQRKHGIKRFFLAISPDNKPSLAMAAKLGFTQVGEQIDDEDGLEYVFELVRR